MPKTIRRIVQAIGLGVTLLASVMVIIEIITIMANHSIATMCHLSPVSENQIGMLMGLIVFSGTLFRFGENFLDYFWHDQFGENGVEE